MTSDSGVVHPHVCASRSSGCSRYRETPDFKVQRTRRGGGPFGTFGNRAVEREGPGGREELKRGVGTRRPAATSGSGISES